MKYFLHDCNSFNDDKISELFLKFGYEGLGLFYTILERIGSQEKPIKTLVLKSQLKVGKRLEKCWEFMEEIGIISSNNGETFNERILSYSEMYQIKKEKNREKISQWRNNQEDKKNVTSYVPVRNQPKVNKSKVKEIEDILLVDKSTSHNIEFSHREDNFYNEIATYTSLFEKNMLRAFFDYWREPNKSKSKMKWEQEKTWDLKLRLERWQQNQQKYEANNRSFTNTANNSKEPGSVSRAKIEALRNW